METINVFLSHNSKDKPVVRQLAKLLQKRGLAVWLDEWSLPPGKPWQEEIETAISTIQSAAVLVGENGLGPWEEPEMRACLNEFVKRKLPVIPVLLPNAVEKPILPMFLSNFTWVDLRGGITEEALDRLQWGITGVKPQPQEQTSIVEPALASVSSKEDNKLSQTPIPLKRSIFTPFRLFVITIMLLSVAAYFYLRSDPEATVLVEKLTEAGGKVYSYRRYLQNSHGSLSVVNEQITSPVKGFGPDLSKFVKLHEAEKRTGTIAVFHEQAPWVIKNGKLLFEHKKVMAWQIDSLRELENGIKGYRIPKEHQERYKRAQEKLPLIKDELEIDAVLLLETGNDLVFAGGYIIDVLSEGDKRIHEAIKLLNGQSPDFENAERHWTEACLHFDIVFHGGVRAIVPEAKEVDELFARRKRVAHDLFQAVDNLHLVETNLVSHRDWVASMLTRSMKLTILGLQRIK